MTDADDDFEGAEEFPGRYVYPGVPSTILELRKVLIAHEAARPRSTQKELGPSEIGTPCAQQIARKLRATGNVVGEEPAWAPFQGTAVHAAMDQEIIPFWNAQLGRERWLSETRLMIDADLGLMGTSDAFDRDNGMVVDWKYVGVTALNDLRAARKRGAPPSEQMGPEYRVQGHLYGKGQVNAGRDVRFIRTVLLARSWKYDDSEEWTEPYRPEVADAAIARYRSIRAGIDAGRSVLDVTATPTSKCYWCPFRRGTENTEDWCSGRA